MKYMYIKRHSTKINDFAVLQCYPYKFEIKRNFDCFPLKRIDRFFEYSFYISYAKPYFKLRKKWDSFERPLLPHLPVILSDTFV